MRLRLATWVILAVAVLGIQAAGQWRSAWEKAQSGTTTHEPSYEDTFSGSVVQLSETELTVSRSILGKPAEKRTFSIKADTRVEGKLRMNAKVTVGFVSGDDGDVARLIVVRTTPRAPQNGNK